MTVTTSSPKSYNYLALRGAGVDDMEFVEQFGLDPAIAYTPKLNDAMLEMTMQQNKEHYINEDGMSEADATKKATDNMMNAKKDIDVLLAQNGMLK